LGRLFIWEISLNSIKDKPILGHGFDRFAPVHNNYQALYFKNNSEELVKTEIADCSMYAFNEFIQVAVESGLIGMLLLLSVFIFGFKTIKKEMKHEEQLYFFAAKASIGSIFICCLFSYPLHSITTLILLYFSLSIIVVYGNHNFINLKVNNNLSKILFLFIIIIISFFLSIEFKKHSAERKWLIAFNLMRENKYDYANKLYYKLYSSMSNNKFFLYNFGTELSLMGQYEKSNEIFNKVLPLYNNSDLYVYMGNNYEKLGKYASAENCYLKASYLMPSSFLPKYYLVGIYKKTGRNNDALRLARNILLMNIKKPSYIVELIKNEMNKFVYDNSSTIKRNKKYY